MICKASQRGGGGQLAAHLLNAHDNVRVEVADMRGCVAGDLAGAFKEWYAQSTTTSCAKYLYSLSINPDQKQGRLTKEQCFDLIGRFEKSLGLTRQGRVVVFHEKKDREGVPREHCHVVWSRIDARRGRAVTISFDRLKRLAVARAFAKELRRTVPHGMEQPPGPERFARKAANSNHAEMQQQERSGISKEERRAQVTEAWQKSHDGKSFAAALQSRGYQLARGGRLSYAVIDRAGEIHGLGTLVAGVRAADVKARLASSHPLSSLLPAEEVKQQVAVQRETLRRLQSPRPPGPPPDSRRAALQTQQEARRRTLAQARTAMEERHRQERQTPEAASGLAGALQRLTAHFQQSPLVRAVQPRQKVEAREMTHLERDLKTLEARERRSLETHIRRDDFRQLDVSMRGLTTLLDRLPSLKPSAEESQLRKAFAPAGSEPDQREAAREAALKAAERLRETQGRRTPGTHRLEP